MKRSGNPKPWIKKAEEDYQAMAILYRKHKTPMYDVVCFHAQQCAEKYLKAFLVAHRIYFPKTRDLVELLNRAASDDPTPALLKPFVSPLNPYAVAFRDPGEHANLTETKHAVVCVVYNMFVSASNIC